MKVCGTMNFSAKSVAGMKLPKKLACGAGVKCDEESTLAVVS